MSNSLDPFQSPSEIAPPDTTGQRLIGVTVFAILNIIFSVMGLIGLVFSIVVLFAGPSFMTGPDPVGDLLRQSGLYALFFYSALLFGAIFNVLLFISGIGLLKMSSRARQLAIAYAIYAIVAGLIGTAVNYFVIFAPMMEQANQGQGPQQFAAMAGIVGGLIGALIGMIFPVAILIYFNRPKVKQAFQA